MDVFRKYILLVCISLFLIFGAASAEDAPAKAYEGYNVILIFIDSLRADHLGCYGYPKGTSPNIDRLAEESAVFEQNFTPVTYTLASFMSIITSLYPNSHCVLDIYKDRLSPKVKTLAEIMQAYGYKTAWIADLNTPHLGLEAGFGRGFEELRSSGSNFYPQELREYIFAWLEKNKDKKFFLNFHTNKVHWPYLPDPKYKQKMTKTERIDGIAENNKQFENGIYRFLYDKQLAIEIMRGDILNQYIKENLSGASKKELEDFFISGKKSDRVSRIMDYIYWRGVESAGEAANAYLQALYDADILELDEELIGPLIDKLKAAGLYDKTLIVICADHGDEFHEHGGYGHCRNLYDELTRVPLIIRVPWIRQGRHIDELTQTVDIMPTVLGLLEIPVPHQAQGKSLAGFINGDQLLPLREYVFGRRHGNSSIRSKEWLLVLHEDSPRNKELYDLRADPGEQENVYFKNRELAAELEARLKEWEASLPSYKDREYSFPSGMDKATQERIRKTGYW